MKNKSYKLALCVVAMVMVTFIGYGQTDSTSQNLGVVNEGIMSLLDMLFSYLGFSSAVKGAVALLIGWLIRYIEKKILAAKHAQTVGALKNENAATKQAAQDLKNGVVNDLKQAQGAMNNADHVSFMKKLIDKVDGKKV